MGWITNLVIDVNLLLTLHLLLHLPLLFLLLTLTLLMLLLMSLSNVVLSTVARNLSTLPMNLILLRNSLPGIRDVVSD
jgi:hypothetical protein